MQLLRRLTLAVPLVVGAAACATTHRAGELEPRYVAVHNALAAMGLAQVGPLQQGSLAEGKEQRVPLELAAQCNTVVVMGKPGVRDIDATLLDPEGKAVAKDATKDAQAVVRACIDTAGTYTLVVKMAAGAGDYLVATWAGGVGGGSGSLAGSGKAPAAGTCDSPVLLAAGTVNGSNGRGEAEHDGSCVNGSGKEVVYQLDVASRQRATFEVDPTFDAVVYLRRGDCADGEEVACNDDAPAAPSAPPPRRANAQRSRIDTVLDPGAYFVFVDAVGPNDRGTYKLSVALSDVPTMQELCRTAKPISVGATISESNEKSFDSANASCSDGAKGRDTVYRLDVPQRSRARVTLHSDDYRGVVHVRSQCADEQSEAGCSDSGYEDGDATWVGLVDPGAHWVFSDAAENTGEGRYTLDAQLGPPAGSGVPGDGCSDAQPLGHADQHVETDTFSARDDVAGKCGGQGAPDVLYKLDLPRKSRVTVNIAQNESDQILVLTRGCGDRATEIACSASIDEVLPAGTYFLAVDGAKPENFGKVAFDLRVRDVGAQDAACRAAPTIADGQTINGSTAGAGDKFSTSCGGREDAQSSPDRMYKIVLPSRQRVRLQLTTSTWDGVLALRKSCLDPTGTSGARGAEVTCNNDSDDAHHARIEVTLDAGTYYVLVDGHASGNEGPFSLEYRVLR